MAKNTLYMIEVTLGIADLLFIPSVRSRLLKQRQARTVGTGV